MRITNNQGIEMDLSDKAIEILSIVYTLWDYKLQKGEYDEAEDFLIKNWYVLWEMFGWILKPNETFCKHIIWEIMSQWEDTMLGNKVLTNLFWSNENNNT